MNFRIVSLFAQPRITFGDDFPCKRSIHRILLQHASDQVLEVRGQIAPLAGPQVGLPRGLRRYDLSVGLPVEGQAGRHHEERAHTDAVHVALRAVGTAQHLRGHIGGGAQPPRQGHAELCLASKAKVDEFQESLVVPGRQEIVLQLDVAVRDAVAMQVGQAFQHLPSVSGDHRQKQTLTNSRLIWVVAIPVDLLSQITTCAEVQDQVQANVVHKGRAHAD
mmetsp:Transcript_70532/g.202052  ORF Transcript_70532/g.202052 Transcript_70532/m.202052 type:complete len:220 (-) Transcript_70532:459-1118(-)